MSYGLELFELYQPGGMIPKTCKMSEREECRLIGLANYVSFIAKGPVPRYDT